MRHLPTIQWMIKWKNTKKIRKTKVVQETKLIIKNTKKYLRQRI